MNLYFTLSLFKNKYFEKFKTYFLVLENATILYDESTLKKKLTLFFFSI